MQKHLLILLGAMSLFLCSCDKDDSSIPLVFTGKVTDITSKGATFTGRVSSDANVLEFGFLWNDLQREDVLLHEVLAEEIAESGVFTLRVEANLNESYRYRVRAFIRTDHGIIKGKPVIFESLGSLGPKISSVVPELVWWDDTISIYGERLGYARELVEVKMGGIEAELISFSTDSLKVKVPVELTESPFDLSVSVSGNITNREELISLIKPIVHSIAPEEGNFLQKLEIIGENFINKVYYKAEYHLVPYPKKTRFYFGEEIITPLILNDTSAIFDMPHDLNQGTFEIYASNYGSDSDDSFPYTNYPLEVISSFPAIAYPGDTITLEGNFFSGENPGVGVQIGYVYRSNTTCVEISENRIRFIVPEYLSYEDNYIYVKVAGKTSVAPEQLSIYPPEVTSIMPASGYFRDTVIIKGNHFRTSQTKILFGTSGANIVSITPSEIVALVPSLTVGTYQISYDYKYASKPIGEFELLPIQVSGVSHDTIRAGDRVTVELNNIPDDVSSMHLRFSGYSNSYYIHINVPQQELTNSSFYFDIPYTLRRPPPGNHQLVLFSGGTSDTIDVFWVNPYKELSDPLTKWCAYKMTTWVLDDKLMLLRDTKRYGPSIIWYEPGSDNWWGGGNYYSAFRASNSVFIIGDYAYCGLGNDPDMNLSDMFNRYDGSTVSWEPIAQYAGGLRRNAVSVSANNLGYVGSGIDESGASCSDFWEYNPSTDSWRALTDMPHSGAQTIVECNEKIFVVFANGSWFNYDPLTDLWTQKDQIPELSSEICLFNIGNEIYFGISNSWYLQIYKYDILKDEWTKKSRINIPKITASNVVNNKAYIYYRYDINDAIDYFVEYDPANDY